MSDNKPREEQAESFIKHHLIKHGFRVAKPSFDIEGADLLILDSISEKSTKFLKIQSKLRSISDSGSSVHIPIEYVTGNFVLFLYINLSDETERLYTFFGEDIEKWRVHREKFCMTISEKTLTEIEDKVFTKEIAELLAKRLQLQEIKSFTSIIIDGVFLEKAVRDTKSIYQNIWPTKEFKIPTLEEVVEDLLRYNQFGTPNKAVNCILFLSEYHSIETVIQLPNELGINSSSTSVSFTIYKSGEVICFQVMEQLKRTINAENVILVADDVAYEGELNDLAQKGINLIVLKQRSDDGSRMYTTHRWGDIVYSLGRSIGLEGYEI